MTQNVRMVFTLNLTVIFMGYACHQHSHLKCIKASFLAFIWESHTCQTIQIGTLNLLMKVKMKMFILEATVCKFGTK